MSKGYTYRGRGGKQVTSFGNSASDTSTNLNTIRKNNAGNTCYEYSYRNNGENQAHFIGYYRSSYGNKYNYSYRGKPSVDQNGVYYPRNRNFNTNKRVDGEEPKSNKNKQILRKPIQLNDKTDEAKLNKEKTKNGTKILIKDKNTSLATDTKIIKTYNINPDIKAVNTSKVTAKSEIPSNNRSAANIVNTDNGEVLAQIPADNHNGTDVESMIHVAINSNKIGSAINDEVINRNDFETTKKIGIATETFKTTDGSTSNTEVNNNATIRQNNHISDSSGEMAEIQKLDNTVAIPDEYKPRTPKVCHDCEETYINLQEKELTENKSSHEPLVFNNSTYKEHLKSAFTSYEDDYLGKEVLIKGLANILLEEEKSSDKLGKALQNVLSVNKQQQQYVKNNTSLEFNPSVLPPPPCYFPIERRNNNNLCELFNNERYPIIPPSPLATVFYQTPVMLPVNVFQYSMKKDITSPLSIQTMDLYHQESYYATSRVLQKVSKITTPTQQYSPVSHNYGFAPFTNVLTQQPQQQQYNKTSPSDWHKQQGNVKIKNDFVIKPTNKKQMAMNCIQSKKVVVSAAPIKKSTEFVTNELKCGDISLQKSNEQENNNYIPFTNFFDDFYTNDSKNAYRHHQK